jgi:hypothetical protein
MGVMMMIQVAWVDVMMMKGGGDEVVDGWLYVYG